jgi:hypothetical protein
MRAVRVGFGQHLGDCPCMRFAHAFTHKRIRAECFQIIDLYP